MTTPKRSSTATGPMPVYFALGALFALVGGTLLSSCSQPAPTETTGVNAANATTAASPVPSALAASPDTSPSPSGSASPAQATVYRVVMDADGSHLEPQTVSLSAGGGGAVAALNAMAEMENSPLPPGTRATGYTLSPDGLAAVNFNSAFKDNFSGSDSGEALTINAVLQTMGQFGAKNVQIRVNGKKIDTLGGMQSLDAPLPVPAAPLTTAKNSGLNGH